jgi:PPOX class probable F420-dependent enzyme
VRVIPDEAKAVIESNALAHVVTLGADGTPQVTLAWVGLEGDEVVFATMMDQRKLRNIRRDERVTISIETQKVDEHGLTEYLVIHGRARVVEGGAPEKLQELAYTYIGPGVKFPPFDNPPPGYVTRVKVDRLGGIGPWAPR